MTWNPCRIRTGTYFSGALEQAEDNLVKVRMNEGSLVRLEKDARGIVVECTEGTLWITQENDLTDHFLCPGECFVIDKKRLVIISAIEDIRVTIRLSGFSCARLRKKIRHQEELFRIIFLQR